MDIVTHKDRVLIIEDDQFVGRAAQKRLMNDGYDVTWCPDGLEGLTLAQNGEYDIILLDHMLPGMNGLDILKILDPDDYHPVVMISGSSELLVAVEALRMGAADYVIKETDGSFLDLLPKTVGRILDHVALMRARDEAERRIAAQTQTIQAVLDNMDPGITLFDATAKLAAHNQQFLSLMGVPISVTEGQPAALEFQERMIAAGAYGAEVSPDHALERSRLFETDQPFVIDHLTPHGKTIEIRGAPMPSGGMIATYTDISERKRMEDELRKLATTDPLTGANNRRRFNEMSEHELMRCKRYDHPLCVLMLDADHFKSVNDTYGHNIGDQVLIEFARTCLKELRDVDVLGRFGGEEFAATLPETDLAKGREVADRLCEALASIRIAVEGTTPISFTVSIGLTALQGDQDTLEALLNRADEALYAAKQAGRNQVKAT